MTFSNKIESLAPCRMIDRESCKSWGKLRRKLSVSLIQNPYIISFKEWLVDAFEILLTPPWKKGITTIQFFSRCKVRKNWMAIPNTWFVRSNWSSVCKWYEIEVKRRIFNFWNKVFQNSDINLASHLLMIAYEIPQLWEMRLIMSTIAQFSADQLVLLGSTRIRFKNL